MLSKEFFPPPRVEPSVLCERRAQRSLLCKGLDRPMMDLILRLHLFDFGLLSPLAAALAQIALKTRRAWKHLRCVRNQSGARSVGSLS